MIVIIPLLILIGILAWWLRPGKDPSGPRKIAILATSIPALAVAIAAVIFQLLHNASGPVEVSGISNVLFLAGLGIISASILASVVFALTRKVDIAKGTGFGACIAVIVSVIELGLLEWLGGV